MHQHMANFRPSTKYTILTELICKTHLPAHEQFRTSTKYTILRELICITHLPAQGQF